MKTLVVIKHRFFSIFLMLLPILYLISCNKTDDQFYNYKQEIQSFDGTVLEYLESKTEYDSMLVAVNRIPGLRDSLVQDSLTVFAVDNASFETVLNQLNTIRNLDVQEPLYLKDLDVATLDTLLSRYIFKGVYEPENISVNTGGLSIKSLKFDYNMFVEYDLLDASGFIDGGSQRLIFSDPNASLLRTKWISTYTRTLGESVNNGIVYPLIAGHSFGFDDFVFQFNK